MTHPGRRSRWRLVGRSAGLAACFALATSPLLAAQPEGGSQKLQQRRAQLLEQMRELAQATDVRFQRAGGQPQLLGAPVFRYDDQPRHFLDATLWIWTEHGRPVAFEKIEAVADGRPRWGYCFTAVSESLLEVAWSDGRKYRSTAPGIDFRPLPDAPPAAERNSARKLAARKLARDFSARILVDDVARTTEQMRLLPTPIYEYSAPETGEFVGAVFGLATSGTNPDVLILLEPRDAAEDEPVWHYAIGRMTIGGVTLKYRDTVVWQVDFRPPRPAAFPTWTFFYTWRSDPASQETTE